MVNEGVENIEVCRFETQFYARFVAIFGEHRLALSDFLFGLNERSPPSVDRSRRRSPRPVVDAVSRSGPGWDTRRVENARRA